jgi:hypothetical protein
MIHETKEMSQIIIVSPSHDSSPIVWHTSNGTFEEVAKYYYKYTGQNF